MKRSKIVISVSPQLLERVDRLVKARRFASRSQAFQVAAEEKLARLDKSRLASECAKLDTAFEQALADERLSQDLAGWPEC
ncbi:MAG: ribbon-helix-helix protein, CopG family [Phycisphaerae bacterium]|nr:ribbon-helix-helix protein, CopG family [Phycisphaerae bacterium]